MTYYGKKAIVSIITTLIVFIYLYLDNIQAIGNISGDMSDVFGLWGLFFVKLLVILIVAQIIITMIFNMINRMITREKEPSVVDERDRNIEMKAIKNFCFVFSFGFFVAMAALMFTHSIGIMFSILAFDVLIAGLVLDISYIIYYNRGF